MTKLARKALPEAVAALIALAAARRVAGETWARGFPLDDAWIHMVYGLQLVRHATLAYNENVAATGATSPLWALVAALAHVVVGARGPSLAAATALKAAGALTHAATSALAARCARVASARTRLAPWVALVAGSLVAVSPLLAFTAVSGMEAELAGGLMLASLLAAARRRAVLAGGAVGLAFLARPECAIVAPLVCAVLALGTRRLSGALARSATAAGIALAFIAALCARNARVSGHPWPATFYAKSAPVSGRVMIELRIEHAFVDLLGTVSPTMSRAFWLLVALPVAALLVALARRRIDRRARLGAAAATAGVTYIVVVAVIVRVASADLFYFQRYFAPALPLLFVAAASGASFAASFALGALRALRDLRPRVRLRALVAVYGVVVACGVGEASWRGSMRAGYATLASMRERYASDVAAIDGVQVAIGHFLASAPPDVATVWSMDAGAVRYWSERTVVDLGKLNTPELFDAQGTVRSPLDADALVLLEGGAVRVAHDPRALELSFAARVPNGPRETLGQLVWRCLAGLTGDEARLTIVGYSESRAGRCRMR